MTPAVSNGDVVALINTGEAWPVYENNRELPLYRQALEPEPIANVSEEHNSGELKLLVDKYDAR